MQKFNTFFTIGTVGMIITAILHIVFALVLKISATASFISVYPVFASFLFIGFAQIIRANKKVNS